MAFRGRVIGSRMPWQARVFHYSILGCRTSPWSKTLL